MYFFVYGLVCCVEAAPFVSRCFFILKEFIGNYSTEEININYPDPAANFVGHQVSHFRKVAQLNVAFSRRTHCLVGLYFISILTSFDRGSSFSSCDWFSGEA